MPIRNRSRYPADWKTVIRPSILERAGNRCEGCGATNHEPHPVTGSFVVLTVAHLNHRPEHCDPANLKALCQRCHNNYDKAHRAANAVETRRLKKQIAEEIASWTSISSLTTTNQ